MAVSKDGVIYVSALNELETNLGITKTTQYAQCLQSQIQALKNKVSSVVVPAKGALITASDFNAIITATKTLGGLPIGAIIELEESSGTFANYIKVANAGHYSGSTGVVLLREAIKSRDYWAASATNKFENAIVDYKVGRSTDTSIYYNMLASTKSKMLATNIPVRSSNGGAVITLSRYMWVPSDIELTGTPNMANYAEGTQFPYFANGASRIALRETGTAYLYWTRTVVGGSTGYSIAINASGNATSANQITDGGFRPCCCISATQLITPNGSHYRLA